MVPWDIPCSCPTIPSLPIAHKGRLEGTDLCMHSPCLALQLVFPENAGLPRWTEMLANKEAVGEDADLLPIMAVLNKIRETYFQSAANAKVVEADA